MKENQTEVHNSRRQRGYLLRVLNHYITRVIRKRVAFLEEILISLEFKILQSIQQ